MEQDEALLHVVAEVSKAFGYNLEVKLSWPALSNPIYLRRSPRGYHADYTHSAILEPLTQFPHPNASLFYS